MIFTVPHTDGHVYELDGLQPGPLSVGSFDGNTSDNNSPNDFSDLQWIGVARAAIQDRIEKYAASEIKFNLMAVVRDRRVGIQSKIDMFRPTGGDKDDAILFDTLVSELAEEAAKRQQWKEENERRRHNYLPFCIELLRGIARSGKLPELTQKANEKAAERRRKAALHKMSQKMSE